MFTSDPPGSKNYILNVSQITEHELELAGEKALNLASLARLGVPINKGFVITSKVFDDFLFANGLISILSDLNRKVIRGEISAIRAEQEITKYIVNAPFPKLIAEIVYRAYILVTENRKCPLQIELSSLNTVLKESLSQTSEDLIVSDEFNDFMFKIKQQWARLFSRQALLLRTQARYKGIISVAIVVSKFSQPEVSGIIYTLSVDNANPVLTEVRAMFGIKHDPTGNGGFFDRYLYRKDTEEVFSKYAGEQPWMLVFKDNKFVKLAVSAHHIKNMKLTDQQIHRLGLITTKLKSYFKNELKIEWIYESGKFTFVGLERLRDAELIRARTLLSKTASAKQNKKDSGNHSMSQESFPMQPLNQLPVLLSGRGSNHGIVYGRVRIIRAKGDMKRISPDDIAVISKSLRNTYLEKVMYKGAVLEAPTDNGDNILPMVSGANDATSLLLENEMVTLDTNSGLIYLGVGHQPITHNKKEEYVARVRPETIPSKEITIKMQRPTTQGIFKSAPAVGTKGDPQWLPNIKSTEPLPKIDEQENIKVVTDSSEVEMSLQQNGVDDDWYLKAPVFKELGLEMNMNSKLWQIVNLENPVILDQTNGLYFTLSKFLEILDVDKYELLRNKPLRRKFLVFLGNSLSRYNHADQLLIALDIPIEPKENSNENEIFDLQLEMINYLRNKVGMRNISIILTDVKTEKDLILRKKLVTASGLRRTATFRVYVSTSSPLTAISIQKIINNGIDGVTVDIDKLLLNLYQEKKSKLTEEVSEFLGSIVEKITSSAVPIFILADETAITDDNLKDFIEYGVMNFVFPEAKLKELTPTIANLEVKSLLNSPKKGRKKKNINYGY